MFRSVYSVIFRQCSPGPGDPDSGHELARLQFNPRTQGPLTPAKLPQTLPNLSCLSSKDKTAACAGMHQRSRQCGWVNMHENSIKTWGLNNGSRSNFLAASKQLGNSSDFSAARHQWYCRGGALWLCGLHDYFLRLGRDWVQRAPGAGCQPAAQARSCSRTVPGRCHLGLLRRSGTTAQSTTTESSTAGSRFVQLVQWQAKSHATQPGSFNQLQRAATDSNC